MKLPFSKFFCLDRKFLLLVFLRRDLTIKYRRSVLGYVWTMLIPLAQVFIFFFVYRLVLKIQIPHYLSFIVSGLFPWVYFTAAINDSLDSLVAGRHLILHAPVPIHVFPAASNAINFINFLPSVPIIFLVTWYDTGLTPSWHWLLYIPLSLMLVVFTYSLSFLLACFYVYLRDIKHLIGIVIQLMLYVTPILYSADMVPEQFRWVTTINPLSGYFQSVRHILFQQSLPEPMPLAAFTAWTLAFLLMADWVRGAYGFKLVEKI